MTEVEDYTTIAPVTFPAEVGEGDVTEATTQQAVPLPFPLDPEIPPDTSSEENMVVEVEDGTGGMDMRTLAKFVEELLDIRSRTKGTW